jgi:hypothetical protein
MSMLPCVLEGCTEPATTREIYIKRGGHGLLKDEVCSGHTGRYPGLRMIGKESIPASAAHQNAKD